MSKLFACISHKGGTGRTVTTVNVGFHLATLGKTVCILDLDLASPTLGAVVGLADIGAGAPPGEGIHDVLLGHVPPEQLSELERDVWTSSSVRHLRTFRCGDFRIVPGTESGGDMLLSHQDRHHRDRLVRVLDELLSRYDFVFCDLRSGIGAVAEAFVSRPVVERLDIWLLFHRWTHQHLVGVIDLARGLSDATEIPTSFMCIRTAAIDPNGVPQEFRAWVNQRNDELQAKYNRLRSVTVPPIKDLGRVPSEILLQWSECILTDELSKTKATGSTIGAFREIASRLIDLDS